MNHTNTSNIKWEDFQTYNFENGVISYFNIHTMEHENVPFTMTASEFKKILRTFDYESAYANMPKWSEDNGVERFKTVPFSYHYYSYVARSSMPPSPQQFVDSYVKDYINVFTINGKTYGKFKAKFQPICSDKAFILTNMKSRILRAYNSFNRELGLVLTINELNYNGISAIYNIKLDMRDGIDVLVKKGNSKVGIATYVSSYRANTERDRKREKYHSGIRIVDYAADRLGDNKNVTFYGDVMLYSDDSVRNFIIEIEKIIHTDREVAQSA